MRLFGTLLLLALLASTAHAQPPCVGGNCNQARTNFLQERVPKLAIQGKENPKVVRSILKKPEERSRMRT